MSFIQRAKLRLSLTKGLSDNLILQCEIFKQDHNGLGEFHTDQSQINHIHNIWLNNNEDDIIA